MKTLFLITDKYFSVLPPLWRQCTLLLLFIMLVPYSIFAQDKIWDKTYGAEGYTQLKVMQHTRDGGFILGGFSNSGVSGDKSEGNKGIENTTDYWILKLDATGKKEWDKTIGSNLDDELYAIQQTRDGGYILGGYSTSGIAGDKSERSKGRADFWVVKLKPDGSKDWDKTIGGKGNDILKFLQQTPDGSYILGGDSNSGISGDNTVANKGESDIWMVKVNGNGQKIWDRSYGGEGDDNLTSFVITPDGGYLIASIIRDSTGQSIFTLIKGAADGTKAWEKKMGILNNFPSQQLIPRITADGDYLVGYTAISPVGTYDYGVQKLKEDGKVVWDKTYGGDADDYIYALQQTNDGGYILGGYSYSDRSSDKSQDDIRDIFGGASSDYWVVKLNADGTIGWDKSMGGNNSDNLFSLQQTSDGGYILGGESYSGKTSDKSEAWKGSNNYWLVKLANTGRRQQNISFEPILLNKTVEDAPFPLLAKASSGLPVIFRVLSGNASVKGNIVTLTGASTVIIQAYQGGNSTYYPAEATQSFVVEEKKLVKKEWDKTLGGYNPDYLTAIVPTPDGGYLVGGYSVSGKKGDKTGSPHGTPDERGFYPADYWIVKLDRTGKKLWDKAYGGTEADNLTFILVSPDGGYLLGGTSASGKNGDKSEVSRGNSDFWVVKIDENGNKIWDRVYGGSAPENLTSILVGTDGGYLLAGTSQSGKSGDKSQAGKGKSDYWLVKVDADGRKIWDRSYGGSNTDRLAALVASSNGTGYLIGGTSASGKNGDKSEAFRGERDYWVVRITADGTKLWDKTFGGIKETYVPEECRATNPEDCYFEAGSSILTSLLATQDGGYLLGGYSNADKGAEKTEGNQALAYNYYESLDSDYWVIKIDDKGAKTWDKIYGGSGNSELASVISAPGGNYLLAGTSNAGKWRDKSENRRVGKTIEYPIGGGSYRIYEPGTEDYWIIQIDEKSTKQWDRTIGSLDADKLAAVVVEPEGGYVLAGSSAAYGIGSDKTEATRDTTFKYYSGKSDYWLVKLKEDFPMVAQWNLRYGGSSQDNFTVALKTTDGGYLAGGFSNSGRSGDKTQSSQGKHDYWIVKSDKNGKKLWDKGYGGSEDDYLNRVIQTQDGGYLLAGSSLSGKSGNKTTASKGDRDYWIVKTDAQGNQQWDKTFGGTGSDDLIKVIQISTGDYVLGGTSNSPLNGDKTETTQGEADYWLVKISKNGSKIWDKRYGDNLAESLGSFVETSDGGFLLGGSSPSGNTGDKKQNSQGGSDYWVVKTDKEGNVVWEKTYGGSNNDVVYSVGRGNDNNYFIAGTSSSNKNGDKSQESKGGKDYWLVKLDHDGNKLWDRTFGGSKDDELRASTITSQGHYVLAGHSYSDISGDKTQANQGESDYWVVEVDAQGNQVQDLRYGGSEAEELRTVTPTKEGGLLLAGRSNSGVSGDRTQPSQGSTDYWLVKVAPLSLAIASTRKTIPEAELGTKARINQHIASPNTAKEYLTIRFLLSKTQAASLKVYNMQGKQVAILFQGEVQANNKYKIEWQTYQQPVGMYLLQLQTPTLQQQIKLLLIK